MSAENKSLRPQPILWDGHLEPKHPPRKKLIIQVATGWLTKEQNPTQPYTLEEITGEVIESYKAGASSWHIHVRHAVSGSLRLLQPERVDIHKRMCDIVFKECPDLITAPSGADPLNDDSVQARVDSYFKVLVEANPHYVDVGVLNMGTIDMGLFPNKFVFTNRPQMLLEQVKAFQALGIKPEFGCYNLSGIEDVMRYFLPHTKKPWYIQTPQGLHNTQPPLYELTKISSEFMPQEDVVWSYVPGGRNWLALAVWGIILGCDVIRVGKEDAVFLYPDQDVKVSRCAQVVAKIATIARELGREIATPREARERLGLRQIS